jgi:hypothetical protein
MPPEIYARSLLLQIPEPLLAHAMELEPMDDTRAIMVKALSGECDETN